MAKHKKILVAFDGSASSQNALKQAIAIKNMEGSWLKVLAVVPAYEGDLELVGVQNMEAVMRGPREKLVAAAEAVAEAEGAHVLTNIEQGEAFEKIVDVAEAEGCDLIVMGRRGMRRLERMLMGSVTARVIGHSHRNVLVVPLNAALGWGRILLATDGSEHSRTALEHALYFARANGASLTAVAVVDMYPEFYADAGEVVEAMEAKAAAVLKDVRQLAEAEGIEIDTELLHGDPAAEITTFAAKAQPGVIFMGSRGRAGLTKILVGSVAEKVIGLAACPVFVAKA